MAKLNRNIIGIVIRLYQSYSVVLKLPIIATSIIFNNKVIEIKLKNTSFHFNPVS